MTKITTYEEARAGETKLMSEMAYQAAAIESGDFGLCAQYLANERGLKSLRRGIKKHFSSAVADELNLILSDDELLAELAA